MKTKFPRRFAIRKASRLAEGLPQSVFSDKISETQQENIQELSETVAAIREQSEVTRQDKFALVQSIGDYLQGEGTLEDVKEAVSEIREKSNLTEADITEIKSDIEAIKTEFLANNPDFSGENAPFDLSQLPNNKETFLSKLEAFLAEGDFPRQPHSEFPVQFPLGQSFSLEEGLPDSKGFTERDLPEIDELTEGGFLGKRLNNQNALATEFDGTFPPNFSELISENAFGSGLLENLNFSEIGVSHNKFQHSMEQIMKISPNLATDMSTIFGGSDFSVV